MVPFKTMNPFHPKWRIVVNSDHTTVIKLVEDGISIVIIDPPTRQTLLIEKYFGRYQKTYAQNLPSPSRRKLQFKARELICYASSWYCSSQE